MGCEIHEQAPSTASSAYHAVATSAGAAAATTTKGQSLADVQMHSACAWDTETTQSSPRRARQEWLRHCCHRCRQSASCQMRRSPTWTETSRIRERPCERAPKTVARVLLLLGSRYRMPRRSRLKRVLFCYQMRSDEGSAEANGKKKHTAAKAVSFRVQRYGGRALKAAAGRARGLDTMQ